MADKPRLLPANLVNMLLSGGVGLLVGILIGVSIGGEGTADKAPQRPNKQAPNPRAPAKPAGKRGQQHLLADFDLDIGTKAAKSVLTGGWKTQPQEDGRSYSLLPNKNANVPFAIAPKAAPYALAVVGKATGVSDDETMDVAVSLNATELGVWSLGSDWSLQWASVPPDALRGASTLLRFRSHGATGEADGAAIGKAAAAFDHLRIEPLLTTAGLDLRSAAGRARLLSGFHAVAGLKGTGKKGARPGVWSRGKRSKLGLLLAPGPGKYVLTLRGSAYKHLAPLQVTVRVNGEAAGKLELADLKNYALDIDGAKLKRGANTVELRYPKTARPADVEEGAKDTRELAVVLYEVSLAPKKP